ncbi:HAMP domain-containing sensor histidine kinase [Treponema sp. UBA3813]|uniref:sensor histidine kinase n=1 Tax=Treponema sp. UBA3813 TaxID=1947715 RepID=UPI0025EF633C|nr:HAMP domain-containing sensor histidine kinase [Treponema sp. UBA3813]
MANRFFKSFSARLALRFMFTLTAAIMLLSLGFLFFTRSLVDKAQGLELKKAESAVFFALEDFYKGKNASRNLAGKLGAISEIPYYLTYIVYDAKNQNLIATNDPFLPFLPDSKGKVKHFFEKDYFFDGDLNIIYFAKTHSIKNSLVVVALAKDMEMNETASIFATLPLAVLFMVIPILILSFFVSFFIIRNTIKPVREITQKAQSITIENLSELPISSYGDELDELSKTFNELFARIKKDFERERQFSSDVSHELNTPLTVISGQTGLLLRWGKDNPEQLEKSLNAIKTEAKTMQAIIANLLQISRIESGRIKPQISEVAVSALFSWIREEAAAFAPKLQIFTEDNGIILNTDSEMLHQILTVLITNSVKYAGGSCTIRMSAQKEGNRVVIEQSDDGPGFSQESLPHLFERFYRADEAHSRKIAGSGLGLAIAQTLCTALGAKIKARNMVPHGAGFSIEFQ